MKEKKRLNIVIFHLAFIYSGGGEKLVLKEAEGLKKLGHNIQIYACCVDKTKCFPDLIRKFEIKEFLPWAKTLLKNHEAFQVVLSSILAPFFAYKFREFDLIFAANQPSLWIAYVVKKMFSKKYVGYLAQPTRFLYPRKIDKETGLYFVKNEKVSFSARLMVLFRKFIKKLDLLSIGGADKILVNGEYMTDLIKKIYKVDAVSCPAGANYLKKPVDLTIKNRNPYILMSNRHVWQKRFEYGLTVFSGLLAQHSKYGLVISGSLTDYTNELKIVINRLGLSQKVTFTGLINDNNLWNLYKLATVYLYTAPEEDYGMGIVEAMGQGVPVIAWNRCGPSKIIENKKNGFLIDSNDVDSFTKVLIDLISNKKMIINMGKNAIERVKNKFSWKNHFLLLEDSFRDLIN